MALINVWHLRKVAESSAKSCDICYKPTTGVLITPDQKDHFYVCQGHLKDRGFATPIIDESEIAAKKKKEEIDKEIEAIKKEYDERMKKRSEKEKKSNDKEKEKNGDKSTNDESEKAEKEKDEKIKAISARSIAPAADDTPRIYALQKVFYQKRIDRIRNTEIAMRNRERLKNPTLFPSVPKDSLG